MGEQVTDAGTERLLRYVAVAAKASRPLTEQEFDEFADNPQQRRRDLASSFILSTPLESMSQYVARLGWVKVQEGEGASHISR